MDELKNNRDAFEENEKSPLDSLKERMKTILSGDGSGEQDVKNAGFTIDMEEEPKPEATEPANEEKGAEAPAEPAKVTAEEPEDAEGKKGRSFLNRMRRFTTNDNGVDVFEIEKPTYELDPVEKILGIEEEKKPEGKVSSVTAEIDNVAYDGDEEPAEKHAGPFISDIDVPKTESNEREETPDRPATADTATIRFTPVSDAAEKGSVKVDTMTHQFDLGGEFTEKQPDTETGLEDLEGSEFDRYVPDEEITDRKAEKHFLHLFAKRKRNSFLSSVLCGALLLILVIFLLPGISVNFDSGSAGLLTASTVILGLIILLNGDMFVKAVRAFSGDFDANVCGALASVSTLALCVFSIKAKINCFPVILVCAFLLFIRSVSNFYTAANYYGNLKTIAAPRPKNAAYLINDESTTVAMARDSIEGKVMIAAGRKADRIADFMKYSDFGTRMFGKAKIITVISLALALISAITAGLMKHSAVEAFYISSAILCAAALPTAFLIDVLPLRSAATRLNRIGAMLTGYAGADKLNRANAVVVKISDIFPHGSVVLKDIKVLSKNNLDDILMRAASLTDALSSPLADIFKQIAKTNDAYEVPDSDTVKYEKRMGISGWVNDELMFIGNRTLLEAHGITNIPDVKTDHDILKHDCFPVYVAMDNKACVMLIVKYIADPGVARQLRNAAELGITLLIDNSDPNVTNEMICDYFDLYEDSVSVMNGAGSSALRAATQPVEECSAPAAYRGNSISLLQIMTSAARIKKSNLVLTVLYAFAAVIGTVYFIYNAFLGNMSVAQRGATVLIFELAATAVSLAAFAFKKP